MGAIGPDKAAVAGQIDSAKAAYIEQRRAVGNRSRSEYLAAIVDYWFDCGCPQLPIEKPVEMAPFKASNPHGTTEGPQLGGTPAARENELQRRQ